MRDRTGRGLDRQRAPVAPLGVGVNREVDCVLALYQMSVTPADGPSVLGNSRIEVRWIMPGPLPGPVIEWFERFPVTTESRQDSYLVSPPLPGLSVKIRGNLALEVKEFSGSRGILDVAGVVQGRLQAWRKWSFPFSTASPYAEDSLSWQRVRKQRRLSAFLLDDAQFVTSFPVPSDRLSCTMELSEVLVADTLWWTFALESIGPDARLQEAIEVTAARFLGSGAPEQMALSVEASGPYSDWLENTEAHR